MLAFIVYGWGSVKRKFVADLGHMECPLCKRVTSWGLWKFTKRATLYWVPVFPYSSQHVMMCSSCGGGKELSRSELGEITKMLNEPPPKRSISDDDIPLPPDPSDY
jgi:hypothetical protein